MFFFMVIFKNCIWNNKHQDLYWKDKKEKFAN